jgi:hypothetical protein|tara:strand:+ start:20018 stop:22153 length:2136 start_codon:yes stop_codon:yes gene_type:complete
VRAGLLAVLLTLAAFSASASADEDSKIVIYDEIFSTSGPVWISVSCLKVGCPGMELVIWSDGVEESHEDPHLVQWSGQVEGNVSWQLLVDSGTEANDLSTEVILSRMDEWTEHADLPNIVPPPGSQGEYPLINTTSPCQLHFCGAIDLLSEGVLYVGALENQSDKDAVMVVGDPGDVILLNSLRGPSEIRIEIWQRGDESKSLVDTIERTEMEHYFEYPTQGELWVRLVHSAEEDYSPYEFEIIRYDDASEAPDGGELTNPWSHGEALPFYGDSSLLYHGHLAASDSQGDSLLIASGAKMVLEPFCSFTDIVSVEIVLHQMDGSSLAVGSGCAEEFETTEQTVSVEFGLTTQGRTAAWSIMLRSLEPGDGSLIGDAPDAVWELEGLDSRWQVLSLGAATIEGSLDAFDTTDVFAFSVIEENGSYVRVQRIGDSSVIFTLMTLDQETGEVVNSTDGSMMIVQPGVHALRIDWGQDMIQGEGTEEYEFSLPYNGPYEPIEDEFVDLSDRARGFYMFAGFMLLTPLMVVLWWNRAAIFSGAPLASDIEEHERRRLRRLRERLSVALSAESIDEGEIEYSLKQLGDSPWRAVAQDWGEPLLRHMTEQVEICVWKISEGDAVLLIGIRVSEVPWEMAAMRIHAPEGARVGISSISPRRLFQEDEIFLDTLSAGSRVFLSLALEGSPTSLGFQLSGLVAGEPLAATPNRALDWGESE